jgi:hypothetical protein
MMSLFGSFLWLLHSLLLSEAVDKSNFIIGVHTITQSPLLCQQARSAQEAGGVESHRFNNLIQFYLEIAKTPRVIRLRQKATTKDPLSDGEK